MWARAGGRRPTWVSAFGHPYEERASEVDPREAYAFPAEEGIRMGGEEGTQKENRGTEEA